MAGFYEEWRSIAAAAAYAALAAEYRMKPTAQLRKAADDQVAGVIDAVFCYSAGAAAALLDVIGFCRTMNLPLPPWLADEVADLSALALSGASAPSTGQGGRFPMDQHRNALERRRRHAWVCQILDAAHDYADADDPEQGALTWGADPDIYADWMAERPEADHRTTEACKIAARRHGDGMREWRTFYDAYAEVQAAMAADGWPGIYYVPSLATAERLDWAGAIEMQTQLGICDWPDPMPV